ncbi:MAG TPA: hypothetical protein VD908_11820 [Cytophagales bacterium]|nr:hypothetical protein [Cytophagales bacterium]
MAACSPVNYSGVSSEVFESLKQELQSKGFEIPGTAGVINGPLGIAIEYSWDQANETLFTQVTEKSFFVSCSQINDQLSSVINKYTA